MAVKSTPSLERVARGGARERVLQLQRQVAAIRGMKLRASRPTPARERDRRSARVDRCRRVILARQLHPSLVHPSMADDVGLRGGAPPGGALFDGAAGSGDEAAKRQVVAVQQVRAVHAHREVAGRPPVVVDLADELRGLDVIRHMSGLDRKPGGAEDSRHRLIDVDEIAGGDVGTLHGREQERAIAPQRDTQRATELRLL